jgi:hypothetical protein
MQDDCETNERAQEKFPETICRKLEDTKIRVVLQMKKEMSSQSNKHF